MYPRMPHSLKEGIPVNVFHQSNPSATSLPDLSPSLGIRASPPRAQQAWHTVGVLLNKASEHWLPLVVLPPAAPPGQQGYCPARPGVPTQPQQGGRIFPVGPGRSLLCSLKRNQPGFSNPRSQAAAYLPSGFILCPTRAARGGPAGQLKPQTQGLQPVPSLPPQRSYLRNFRV